MWSRVHLEEVLVDRIPGGEGVQCPLGDCGALG